MTGWAVRKRISELGILQESPWVWLHETGTYWKFHGLDISWESLNSEESSLEPSSQGMTLFLQDAARVLPDSLSSSLVWLSQGELEWFVEPLMEKGDTLNHECQKLKLSFRIYYWSQSPFALLKMQMK